MLAWSRKIYSVLLCTRPFSEDAYESTHGNDRGLTDVSFTSEYAIHTSTTSAE